MFWLHLYAAVQFCSRQSRTVDRGCQPAPGLPCALIHFEATKQSSGEMRRERAKVCLPLGMRIEARRCQPLTPSLRAQRSNPVCRRGKMLDCFAAFAMTMLKQLRADTAISCRRTPRRAGPLPFFTCRSALVTKPSCSETKRSRGPRLAAKPPRRERF